MKVIPLLLTVSLAANAAWLTVTWHSSSADAPAIGQTNAARPSGASSAASSGANGEARLSPAAAAIFADDNPEALRDLLRASGLSEELVRSIVQMRIWKKYEARFKALNPLPTETNQAWWKDGPNQIGNRTKDQRDEARRLQREVKEESERLLGADPNQNRWQSQQFSFLAPDKRQALLDIQQDYQDLINEVHQDTQGFRLASDGEKLRYLQAEQKRDIESLLSPEERQAYELRHSSTAQQLRGKMTALNATEQEYLAIFPLQKAFDDQFNPQNNDPFAVAAERDQAYWKARQAAEAQLQAQIKAVVGEARYAESIRKQDNDWRQLEAATRRLTLPADTPARLYTLRDTTASAAQQIAANAELPAAQKKQALAELAAATREQIRTHLGSEGADAYFKNNGMRWLKELEKGNTITFKANDSGWSSKALPKETQKAASP
jgi:hypothetical protein